VSLSQGHRAASGKPTAAPAPAAGAVADDAAPSPDAERQQRVAASSNPETANTTGELTAKPHGQTAPHLDLRVDESMATAKPGSVGATDPTPNPQPLGSVANALTPAASAAPTALPPDAAPIQIAGLAVEIAARAQAGRNRFEIRLDPPELGRIDVRLDVDASDNVTSRLVVERAETLEVLRRDAGDLQRALQDAGLKTSDNGLQFALRDQNFAGRRDGGEAAPPRARLIVPDAGSVTEIVPDYARVNRRGIDIRV
jgi:flagellar hook-length control protein FliK